jgi:CRP-like cAMP-binding protein
MKIPLQKEIELLKAVPLFHTLKDEELKIIALTTENIIYEPLEIIVNEGDEGDEAYIIYYGYVEIFRKTADGELITLNKMGPGGMLGEFALFGNGLRTASVKAIEETLVCVISKEKFYEIIRAFPDTAIEMLKNITTRFALAEDRIMRSITLKE